MSINYILFDLDGTLLPMDQDQFVKAYIGSLSKSISAHGYDPEAIVNALWCGIRAIDQSDEKNTNEAVFWTAFCSVLGEKVRQDEPKFTEFYKTEFQKIQTVCGYNPESAKLVKFLKDSGKKVVLATNPVFPAIATESRMRWAGLDPADFDLYTTYENSHSCKPSLTYYEEILARLGVEPCECLMIGNDVGDDMVAKELGMNVFLLTDCLINTAEVDISQFPHGDFNALWDYVKTII